MAAQEGQSMRRLLRVLAQAGIAAVTLCRHLPPPQQQQQSQQPPTPSQTPQQQQQQQQQQQVAPPPPLLDCLGRFQILCGGVVAALAAHAPMDAAFRASSSGASPAPSGVLTPGPGIAQALMSALYGYCCEADNAGIAVLAANPGVAAALALSLSYGARVLGVEVNLAQALQNLQPCAATVVFGVGGAAAGGNAITDPSVRGGAGGGTAAGAPLGAPAVAAAMMDSGGGGGAAALSSLDAAGALGAAVYAMHALRALSVSSLATEALVAADCGSLNILRTLSYFLIHRSMDQTTALDEEAFAVQAIASGTLARLAEQPAVRGMAVVREALAPPPEVLSAMALLLMLPPAPPPPLIWGAAAGDSAAAASRSFVASLLAAIAQYGPYSYEMFTQVIVNTRGALGTIISLLPSPTA
ncbi:hypothetical protein Vretifemale_3025, partial [Volvox reticuliferus]